MCEFISLRLCVRTMKLHVVCCRCICTSASVSLRFSTHIRHPEASPNDSTNFCRDERPTATITCTRSQSQFTKLNAMNASKTNKHLKAATKEHTNDDIHDKCLPLVTDVVILNCVYSKLPHSTAERNAKTHVFWVHPIAVGYYVKTRGRSLLFFNS